MNSCTFESLTLTPDTPIINTRTVRLQCKMSDHRFNHYSNFIVFDVDPFIIINHLTVLKSAHFFNCYRPCNAFKIIVVYVTENMSEWDVCLAIVLNIVFHTCTYMTTMKKYKRHENLQPMTIWVLIVYSPTFFNL